VDGSRNEFFSGTAFYGNQNGSVGRRNELNLVHYLSQARTSPNDLTKVLLSADFIEQVSVMSLEVCLSRSISTC
jgi:hypothetical protein